MEPRPVYDLPEREIKRECREALRDAGWLVIDTSQDRATRRQQSGLPDLLCFREDHTLLIECKTLTGRLRDSQQKFWLAILHHAGRHLEHAVIRDVAELWPWTKRRQT